MKTKNQVLWVVILLACASAWAFRPVAVSGPDRLAFGGYDPVYLLQEERLAEGVAYLNLEWKGAEWRFVSQRNLEAFRADPAKYAPAYGGYCAACVAAESGGAEDPKPTVADPAAFFVYEGKVYVFHNEGLRKQFAKDPATFIAAADDHWERWRREGKIGEAEPS